MIVLVAKCGIAEDPSTIFSDLSCHVPNARLSPANAVAEKISSKAAMN
jgi:hypothetical protein